MEVMSAGSNPCYVHPNAIRVMTELGIDISNQRSKHVEEYQGRNFDYVISLCAEAAEEICPRFPGKAGHMLHWNYPDPVRARGGEEEVLQTYRDVRDDIKTGIEEWIKSLAQ